MPESAPRLCRRSSIHLPKDRERLRSAVFGTRGKALSIRGRATHLNDYPHLPGISRGQGVVVTTHTGGQRRVCEDVRAVEQLVDSPDERQPGQNRVVHALERRGGEATAPNTVSGRSWKGRSELFRQKSGDGALTRSPRS